MNVPGNTWSRCLAPVLVTLALVACGPQDPEARLEEAATDVEQARQKVEAVREEVQSAKDDLQSLQAAVDDAQAQLAEARKKLRRKQEQLAAERNELHSTASDTAIFRLVQTRLLDEPSLSTAAVGVDVIDGQVTLRGEVESPEQKETAERIASGTPGVEKVVNLVDVSGGSQARSET